MLEETTPYKNDFSRHPPIEKFNTIDGLLKSHAAHPEQTPLICYPRNGVSDYEDYTAATIDRLTDAAVQFYISHGIQPADPMLEKAPVCALLAPSNFEIVLSIFALNRLGWAVLFLSTRLTASAYARLLAMADCSSIIVSQAFETAVSDICQERPSCKGIPLLRRDDYVGQETAPAFQRKDIDPETEGKKIAFIVHSSGSTGAPKPIFLSNTQCLANFRKSFGLRAFCTSPLFHSHGLMELFRCFYTRATMFLWNHAVPITSQNLIEAMNVAKPELVAIVPYILKLLAEKSDGIQALAKAKIVIYGGSSCPDDLGNRLVAEGVNLVANYGATETGQIMTSFRPSGDKEWQYMRLHRPVADYALMDEIAPGVFECVGLNGLPSKGPSNSKPPYSNKNPPNSFRTADLFTRHPNPRKSNYYKYLSRLDDRITLVLGEKVLPLPMEGRIRQEDLVREAVVFGFERSVPGVLIFRSVVHGLDLPDQEFLDTVWPAVEAANAQTETFARIPKELVVIKGPQVTYPRTDKGTFIRQQVYSLFRDDINEIYRSFDGGTRSTAGLRLDRDELERWLLSKFRDDLRVPLPSAETDIFSAGVDSLQTLRIWRTIKKDLDLGGHDIGQNVVFERGTVRSLAAYLYRMRSGNVDQDDGDEIQVMQELIDKYSSFVAYVPSSAKTPEKEVVVVTGGTGSLGAFIIQELVRRQSVGEVYALVRASDKSMARSRVEESLRSRHIALPDDELSKIRALPCDLSDVNLGLPTHELDYLLSSATVVIHSAWAVNFNLGVRSFEAQHIRGTHNLLNFCLRSHLSSPSKFFFCSSVSTASATPQPASIPEHTIANLDHAQKTGYGRSKLVTEQIVRNAMLKTGMYARVLRIGQLSGDTVNGIWNETEAIALMIRTAITAGSLPALDERPSWLPVDTCARCIADLSISTPNRTEQEDADLVYHLVNPCRFSWTSDLLPALLKRTELPKFAIVSPQEWLQRLEQSEQDPAKNPSIKILDFWRNKYAQAQDAHSDVERMGLDFETLRTRELCPALGEVRDPISKGLVEKYCAVWLQSWQSL